VVKAEKLKSEQSSAIGIISTFCFDLTPFNPIRMHGQPAMNPSQSLQAAFRDFSISAFIYP